VFDDAALTLTNRCHPSSRAKENGAEKIRAAEVCLKTREESPINPW
jgi:hypothetical protein